MPLIDQPNDEIHGSRVRFAEPAATELGELESGFFAGRYDYVTEVLA